MRRFQLGLLFLLLAAACAEDVEHVLEPNESGIVYVSNEDLQNALDSVLTEYGGKGISAAVVFPDKSIWLGTAHADSTYAVRSGDLFWTGSITKMYTATVILQLVEEGKLELDDKINQFLPTYLNIDGNITIKQLLQHTSGVADYANHPEYYEMAKADRSKVWTPEEVVTQLITEPYFAPGEGWRYSNTNYTLLGMIAEQITGNNISSEFKRRIYAALSLRNTFLDCQETTTSTIVPFWLNMDDDPELEEAFIPFELRASETSMAFTSGGLFVTAEECARFTHALLRGELLSRNTMDQMLDFKTDLPPEFDDRGYGLGVNYIRLSMVNGAEAYGHGGDSYHLSCTAYLKDYDVTITIQQNYPKNWGLWINSMNTLCEVVMDAGTVIQ